jgi:hypothetical protein
MRLRKLRKVMYRSRIWGAAARQAEEGIRRVIQVSAMKEGAGGGGGRGQSAEAPPVMSVQATGKVSWEGPERHLTTPAASLTAAP